LESISKQATVYGADEIISLAAKVTLAGEPYLICMDVARYGDRWLNLNLSGNIGALLDISVFGGGALSIDGLDF